MKTDSQLQKDIMEELSWEPMLNACEIGVSVRNGVVTLDGYVDSYAQKLAAERAAKRLKDVRAVAEEIKVRIPSGRRKTDSEIAEVALFALEWDTAVPDQDIRLKVENGWLTLDGRVDYQFQKEAAFDEVRQLKGVKGVVNLLLVRPPVDVTLVKDNIHKALERRSDIDSDNISVMTEGNKVVLTGTVRSCIERQAVENAVWFAPGVVEVQDNLVIEP